MSIFSPIFYIFSPPAQWQYRCAPPGTAFHGSHRSSQVNVDGLKRGADASTTISVQTLFTRTLRSLMFDNDAWELLVDWCVGVLGHPSLEVLNLLIQQNWDVPTKRSCWSGVGVTVQLYMGFSDLCIESAETRRVGEKNGL